MKITEQEVRYVAGLANLELNDSEISRMARDLDDILTHIDKLNEDDEVERHWYCERCFTRIFAAYELLDVEARALME